MKAWISYSHLRTHESFVVWVLDVDELTVKVLDLTAAVESTRKHNPPPHFKKFDSVLLLERSTVLVHSNRGTWPTTD